MTFQGELYKKELGQNRIERSNEEWILVARREAVRISSSAGRVSINELHDWADATGLHPESELAYTTVFRGKEWKSTGQMVPARHKGSHGRRVLYWVYESTIY